jgi:hypothetical protein
MLYNTGAPQGSLGNRQERGRSEAEELVVHAPEIAGRSCTLRQRCGRRGKTMSRTDKMPEVQRYPSRLNEFGPDLRQCLCCKCGAEGALKVRHNHDNRRRC